MLIAIYGSSAVGKTTMLNYLDKNTKYKRIVTYTTRAKRTEEVNGYDYYFTVEEIFSKLDLKLVSKYQDHYYGTNPQDLDPNLNRACVVDANGILELMRDYSGKLIVVKLVADLDTRIKRDIRAKNREICDQQMLDSINTYSFVVDNTGSISNLYTEIDKYIKIWEELDENNAPI